ncbi:Head domain of trimeric autotransporter adhesin [Paraburkholderia phenazinium]|uniref:Head domain of trimeric autotransporter adhesin n=2 Tax=Paraburkholderia phenazinium TaxID=60549 RepID=A0A1G8CUJ1_9BURK|nr:Head domain of trimeric autotransporter adhesin [Paraburkholderia phenazinium]
MLLGATLLGAADSTVLNVNVGAYSSPVAALSGDIALGQNAVANSTGGPSDHAAVAVGFGAQAVGARTVAMGWAANASATDALAFGYYISASANGAVALGAGANASGTNSVALGFGSVANRGNAVSVGTTGSERQIINVAAGAQATDAVNVSQLLGVTAALGAGTSVNSTTGAVTAPSYNINGKTYNDVGSALAALSASSGTPNAVLYDNSNHTSVTLGGSGSTAMVALHNVAAGTAPTDAVNLSQLTAEDAKINANGTATAAALGGGSTYNTTTGAITNPAYNVGGTTYNNVGGALTNLDGRVSNAVTYDNSNHSSVTLGGSGSTTPVALHNVSAGALNASSTDAVNGSQLYTTNQQVAQNTTSISTINTALANTVNYDSSAHDKVTLGGASGTTLTNLKAGAVTASSTDALNGSQLYKNASSVAAALGGNTIVNADGTIGAPTYKIGSTSFNDVGDALTNLDGRTTSNTTAINSLSNSIINGTIGLVQQDPVSGDITVGQSTNGTHVDFAGTAGARELTGVAMGTTQTSAVNLSQLSPVVSALGGGATVNADGSISGPMYHVQGGSQTTVGAALDSLDDGLNSLQQGIATGSIGIVTQDPVSRTINVGGATDGLLINMAGTAGARVVTGVANGAVGKGSQDAVNGSQLYANANSMAAALGGGSTVNADGTVAPPSYAVGGTTFNNVGSALTNLDGRVTQNSSDIAGIQNTISNISGTLANAVQYDSSAHNSVTLGGANAPQVKLTNLQNADLSATSTDAVTGQQLYATNQQVADLSQAINNSMNTGDRYVAANTGNSPAVATGTSTVAVGGGGAQATAANSVALGEGSIADQANTVSVGTQDNQRRITNVAAGQAPTDAVNLGQMQAGLSSVARSAFGGVAAATALTMIPDVDAGKTIAVGVASANYKGYQATALGATARINDNVKIKLGMGIGPSNTTWGAGMAYQW